jgi:hypothetical protein
MTLSVLMLIPFGLVMGIGALFVWLATRQSRRRRALSDHERYRELFDRDSATACRTFLFGHPSRWVAVRSRSLSAVQRALGLHNATPCSWSEGIARVNDRKLFISPPIHGWILVIGPRLPDPSEDVDACFRFLIRVSRELGEVQFFGMNRIVGHHAWARMDRGRVIRGYAWAGETLWNQGPETWAERKLNLQCHGYFAGEPRNHFTELEQARANVEKVMLLAAMWSLDPSSVDENALTGAVGVAGDLSKTGLR